VGKEVRTIVAAELKDKVIIVTGGASGIGEAFVVLAYGLGAKVVAMDIQQDLLDRLVKRVSALDGGELSTAVVDVTDSGVVRQAVEAAVDRHGRIDGCFNNAGITHDMVATPEMPDELFEHVMRVNAFGCFYVLKHVLGVMRAQKSGAIVNTASTAGVAGLGNFAPYVASKHAVVGLTKAAALEGAAYNVRVNSILPGYTDTPIFDMYNEGMFGGDLEAVATAKAQWAKNVPLGRFGRPGEIARVAAFLLSDDASFLSGESIRIDGAQLAGFYDGVAVSQEA
jgi:NAD(P)-dependent dehydrogenase (short-subunit alcohol dehydrogenase family)